MWREIGKEVRIDAERFCSEYIRANAIVHNLNNTLPLIDFCSKVTQGSNPQYVDEGLPCLNGKNVYWGGITPNECNFITEKEYERLKAFALKKNDIVITLKHASKIGRAWIVTDTVQKIFSRNIGLIRLKNNSAVLPTTLLFYLWANPVQAVIDSMATGGTNGQITLPVNVLKQLKIPVYTSAFQLLVKNIYDNANEMLAQADSAYMSASSLLIHELGLDSFVPEQGAIAVKTLRDSFGSSGRLDAEYYQSKYESTERVLHGNVGMFAIHDSNYLPKNETKYRYIELADIGPSGNIAGATINIGVALPSRARRRVKTGQVLVSSIEGSLSSCALVTDEYNNAICSTGFYVVDSKQYNSETLLVLIKSPPIQALLKRRCSGTILTAINKDEMERLPLPAIKASIQTAIASQIRHSFELRRQAERLLERAKHAVELAIESGEDNAIAWGEDIK